MLQFITKVNSKGQRAQGLHCLGKGLQHTLKLCCCPVLGDAGCPSYTSHSSECLCRPAVHSGNVNPFFCTHLVSISHLCLAKRKVFARCKITPLPRSSGYHKVRMKNMFGDLSKSLPKWLLQTNFTPSLFCCVPGLSVLLLNPSPAAAAFKEENYSSSAFSNWK